MPNNYIISMMMVTMVVLSMIASSGTVQPKVERVGWKVVKISSGSIRGQLVKIVNLQPPTSQKFQRPPFTQIIEQYLGVPYALPPVSYLRFMPPVTLDPWEDIRPTHTLPPVCPQSLRYLYNHSQQNTTLSRLQYLRRLAPIISNQSEDCLYMNIYVPRHKKSTQVGRDPGLLPVMVYIHGESYDWNSGNAYDGSVLAALGNVVVITVNYRLGVLGFLSTKDSAATGNYGLLDQIAALHWIHENIANFGGDHTNMTVFGHDTGSSCVHLLMLSPVASGLFARVILMSGSAESDITISRNPVNHTTALAMAVGCPTTDNLKMVHCLRSIPVNLLVNFDLQLPRYEVGFGPVVDGIAVQNDPKFQLRNYHHFYKQHDLMIGVTRSEQFYDFSESVLANGINTITRHNILQEFVDNIMPSKSRQLIAMIINEYTDWTKNIQHPNNILDSLVEILSDARVVAPVVSTAKLHSDVRKTTFMYVFNYIKKNTEITDRFGSIHGQELAFVFGAPFANDKFSPFGNNFSSYDVKISEIIIAYWTNFARTGNPNISGLKSTVQQPKYRPNKMYWPPYEQVHQKYLSINSRSRVKDHYRAHKLSVWLNLVPQLKRIPSDDFSIDTMYVRSQYQTPWLLNKSNEFTSTVKSTTTTELLTTKIEMAMPKTTMTTIHVTNGTLTIVPTPPEEDFQYATALTLTIAVGCSLLILNVMAFIGMCYQQDKNRKTKKARKIAEGQCDLQLSSKESLSSIQRNDKRRQIHSDFLCDPSNSIQNVPSVATIVPPEGCIGMTTQHETEPLRSGHISNTTVTDLTAYSNCGLGTNNEPDVLKDETHKVITQNKPDPPPRSVDTKLCHHNPSTGTQV